MWSGSVHRKHSVRKFRGASPSCAVTSSPGASAAVAQGSAGAQLAAVQPGAAPGVEGVARHSQGLPAQYPALFGLLSSCLNLVPPTPNLMVVYGKTFQKLLLPHSSEQKLS